MILTILAIIVVLAGILGVLWTINRQEELDDREAELTAQSLALDERANRIAADEQTLLGEWEALRQAQAMFVDIEISPSGDGK